MPAYAVDFDVKDCGVYCCVITEEMFGDYLFYSSSSYEPSIFVDNKLYTFTKAYQAGILTDEMLAELADSEQHADSRYPHNWGVTRYLKGDADGDGDVNVVDATCIQRYTVGILNDGDFFKPLADVDNDQDVNVIDSTVILRHVVGICEIK